MRYCLGRLPRIVAMGASISVIAMGTALAGPTYTFSTSVGLQPPNVGTITVSQVDPTTVDVLVDLVSSTYGFLNTGGPHTPFAFNISGTEAGISAAFIQPANGTYTFGVFTLSTTNGVATPYGTYGISINDSAGNGSAAAYYGDLEFTVTRTSGLDTTDFVTNSDGYYFAADLTNGAATTGSQAWATITNTNYNPTGFIPEPASASLFGAGLAVLGLMARRRGRSAA